MYMPGKKRTSGKKSSIRSLVRKELSKAVETKHRTTVSGAFDYIPSTGILFNLSAISQGTGDNQRVGNRITATKLHIKKIIRLAYSATAQSNGIRALVVKSRGGPLTITDMPNYYSPVDLDLMYVLDDRMVTVSGRPDLAGTSFDPDMAYKYEVKKKLNLNLHYNDTATTATDSNLYLYLVSEVPLNNAEQAGFETLYYKDA